MASRSKTRGEPYYKYDPKDPFALALEEGRQRGWFRIVGNSEDHGPVYELTAEGIRFVDECLPRNAAKGK